MFRYRSRSKQYDTAKKGIQFSLSNSSLANKDKRSTLMSSENDFLQPNTGDIPLETIDHLRKLTMYLI